jgi:ribonuclease P protein component
MLGKTLSDDTKSKLLDAHIKSRVPAKMLNFAMSDKAIETVFKKQEKELNLEFQRKLDDASTRGRVERLIEDAVQKALEEIKDKARLVIANA